MIGLVLVYHTVRISGIFVIMLGLKALIYNGARARWTCHWPLVFMPVAVFLLFYGEI